VNIALTKQLESFVDLLVKSGRYKDRSEVVRAGLRALQKEERSEPAWLESAIAEGVDSGPSVAVDKAFWNDFEKRAQERMKSSR